MSDTRYARLRVPLALSVLLHLVLLAPWPGNDADWCCAANTGIAELAVRLVDAVPSAGRPPMHVPRSHAVTSRPPPASDATGTSTSPAPDTASVPGPSALAAAAARNRLAHDYLAAQLARYFTYPALARRQGWEGQVLLAVTIEADGQLENPQVATSSGYAVLDAAALHALQRVGRLAAAADWLAGTTLDMRLPVIYRLTE
jgi:protein TonB